MGEENMWKFKEAEDELRTVFPDAKFDRWDNGQAVWNCAGVNVRARQDGENFIWSVGECVPRRHILNAVRVWSDVAKNAISIIEGRS